MEQFKNILFDTAALSKQHVCVWFNGELVYTQDNYLDNTVYIQQFDITDADFILNKSYLYEAYGQTYDWCGVATCSLTWVKY